MKIAGNPRIFGPVLSSLLLLAHVVIVVVYLKDITSNRISPYIGTPNQTYVLCLVLGLNVVFLLMALIACYRSKSSYKMLKPLVFFQFSGGLLLLIVGPANYFLIALFLIVFSWVFGAITLSSSELKIENVSDLGIYEVSKKN